jgi:hypothetical protein
MSVLSAPGRLKDRERWHDAVRHLTTSAANMTLSAPAVCPWQELIQTLVSRKRSPGSTKSRAWAGAPPTKLPRPEALPLS